MASEILDEKAIFNVARQIGSPDARAEYLRQACGADAGLRERVQDLLRAYEEQASFLESPAPVGVAPTIDVPASESTGTIIGPYKLIEQIGEGGMGTVWMAQQTEPVKRLVAVKLIKAGMDTVQVIARFEAERQALALMDHPNIARVLDGGTSDAGRPYFVMDLVRGVPITKYCDEHRLTPRQRLELFVPVCQAIQHAHQKGIIHRDLKPSNVLVAQYDGRPVPKVIDFGVAKAAGQSLTDKTLVTGFGAIVGTLEYMSPEQAEVNQLDIDTRSDIYSLGVLLYELLAGSPPFSKKELEKAGMLEMLRVIREQEPSKPSTKLSTAEGLPTLAANRGTEPAKLTKLVRGELDWIVMKALEKDRNRRYETAKGFAMDVQRYLADEAVQACPPSAGYRFRKFARRNKGGLAVAALVLSFLVLLGSGIGWAVRDRSAREAEAIQQQTARQEKVAGQVESIFAEVDRLEKEQKWPEALAAARRAAAAVAGGEADAETTERVRQRLKDLEFLDRLEQIRMQRATWVEGNFDNAGADRDYAQAFRDYGSDVDELAVEASVERLKARQVLAIALAAALDDWVGARRAVSTEDTAGWKRLLAVARGIDPEPSRDTLRSAWGQPIAEMQDELRRLAESIDIRAQHPATICVLVRNLKPAKHLDPAVRLLRDAQYFHPGDFWLNFLLAESLKTNEDREGAIRYYTAAVSIRPHSTAALNNLGNALRAQKKLDEAAAVYRKAIEVDPKFAYGYNGLGNALSAQKKLDEATAAYRKAIELDPKFARGYNGLGNALSAQKKLDEAIAAFRKAIELAPTFAEHYSNLGNGLRMQGKLEDAIAACRKAIELDPKFALAQHNLGIALNDQKKLDEAIAAFRKAIELDPTLANAYSDLGKALRMQGKLEDAIAACRKAIELGPKSANAYILLGLILEDQGKLDDAIDAHREALELAPKSAIAYSNLGNALRKQGKLDDAIAACRKAIELDPKSASAYSNLGGALRMQGKLVDAIAACRKAIELDPKHSNAYTNLGGALTVTGNQDDAVAACRKAIELDPKSASAYSNLGGALRKQGKLEDAIAACRKAIELDPKSAAAYSNLGGALFDQKKWSDAIDAIRKAIELDPNSAAAYSNLGIALAKQEKLDDAVAALRKALKLNPKHASAHRNLGEVLNHLAWTLATDPVPARRDPGRAVTVAKEAVDLNPRKGDYHNTLGVALYRAERWSDSVATLEKSMELRKGGDSNDWYFLAMAQWRLGMKDKAREWYERAVQWMDKNQPKNEELRRFRAEAAELLELKDK